LRQEKSSHSGFHPYSKSKSEVQAAQAKQEGRTTCLEALDELHSQSDYLVCEVFSRNRSLNDGHSSKKEFAPRLLLFMGSRQRHMTMIQSLKQERVLEAGNCLILATVRSD
jgi:hypothetical protein